ncbi:MAG: M23 family metallopeptidase [Prolixibacteraceae bacterium]|nr:M23 family metallopeptidase [Prolixibacteraceae bacterium]
MKKYYAEAGLIILTILVVIGTLIWNPETQRHRHNHQQLVELQPSKIVWGFPLDSIQVDTLKIKANQSLSDLLMSKGVTALAVDQLARNALPVFDVRRFRAGNSCFFINSDSTRQPEFFIYEESPVSYVVFRLDSLAVYRGEKPITTITRTLAGRIESSLWNAFVDQGSSPALAIELSDIFAWTIDFFGIQAGDQYRVLYDEKYVEEDFVGIGRIHATSFINMGDTVFAYYFNENNQDGYFDDKGQSLKKAFLKAPLQFSRISSHFSHSRLHPVLKIRRPHKGVDYAAPTGTPVYSIGDGVVVKKSYQKNGGGNYLNIKHNSVYTSQYMHLHGFAKGIENGVRVKQGQLIGYVGKTGLATGPHLDFRIYMNGAAIDPLKVKAPPVEPVNAVNLPAFQQLRDSLKTILLAIPLNEAKID